MKKILLLTTALVFFALANAQTNKTKTVSQASDTTWRDQSEPLKRAKIANGTRVVQQEAGKYSLFATYKEGKITGYYAVDAKGNKLPVSVVARPVATSSGKFKCYACVKVCNEAGKCVEECTEDGCPEGMGVASKNAAIKTAQ